MAEYIYEGLFILNSNRYGRDPEGVAGAIQSLIEKQEGTVLVSRLWEERRLAYPIDGQRKGTYWLTYFRMDGEKMADLNQQAPHFLCVHGWGLMPTDSRLIADS